ncbi:hypothetical protein HY449_02855 [Candidatus Pacearchaeota archaeon]|nr:hypothetical protein [Candidatus Pacearchaeota archaeon]
MEEIIIDRKNIERIVLEGMPEEGRCIWEFAFQRRNGNEDYSSQVFDGCSLCDGTEECGRKLKCGNFFPLKYGD